MSDILLRLFFVIKAVQSDAHPHIPKGRKGAGQFAPKDAPAVYDYRVDYKTTDLINEALERKFPETPYGKHQNGFITRDGKHRGFNTIHYVAAREAADTLEGRKRSTLKKLLERYRNTPDSRGLKPVDLDTTLDSGVIRISGDRAFTSDPSENALTVDFRAGKPSSQQIEAIRNLLPYRDQVILERLNPEYISGKSDKRYLTTSNHSGYDADPMHTRMSNAQVFDAFMTAWRNEKPPDQGG